MYNEILFFSILYLRLHAAKRKQSGFLKKQVFFFERTSYNVIQKIPDKICKDL